MELSKSIFMWIGIITTSFLLTFTISQFVEYCLERIRLRRCQRMGYWKKIGADIYECSICGQMVMTKDILAYRYCHGCGKEMGGIK